MRPINYRMAKLGIVFFSSARASKVPVRQYRMAAHEADTRAPVHICAASVLRQELFMRDQCGRNIIRGCLSGYTCTKGQLFESVKRGLQ
jgi:hypothetical protein